MLDGGRTSLRRLCRGIKAAAGREDLLVIAALHAIVIGAARQIVAQDLADSQRRARGQLGGHQTPGQQGRRRQNLRRQADRMRHRLQGSRRLVHASNRAALRRPRFLGRQRPSVKIDHHSQSPLFIMASQGEIP